MGAASARASAAPPPASGIRAEKLYEVDGLTVGIMQMDPWSNLALVARLVGYAAPALPQAFPKGKLDIKAAKKLANMDVGKLSDAMGELFKRLTPTEVESLTRVLLDNVTIDDVPALVVMDGKKLIGRLMTILRILGLVLTVELAPFFAELLAALPEPEKEEGEEEKTTASPSSSPNT
jgi:hypothetical protein